MAQVQDGVEISDDVQVVSLSELPSPPNSPVPGVFGIGNEGRPSVIPDGKRVGYFFAPPAAILQTAKPDWFEEHVNEAMTFAGLGELIGPSTFRTAVELFGSSHFEGSRYGAFLVNIGVLEVLKNHSNQPPELLRLVRKWQSEVEALGSEVDTRRRQSILSSLKYMERVSIGSAIRELVEPLLGQEAAKKAARLYGLRSDAVHGDLQAMAEAEQRLPELAALVRDVLVALAT